jgi:hypothetical protein
VNALLVLFVAESLVIGAMWHNKSPRGAKLLTIAGAHKIRCVLHRW